MEHDPLAERAFRELYPDKRLRKKLVLRYSGRFKEYNATITRHPGRLGAPGTIEFSLSKEFLETSDEVRMGVMQHLLNKLYKTREETLEIQLYNRFIKKLTDYALVENVDEWLQARFDKLNQEYFNGYMMTPNLQWGGHTLTKLGDYTFATNTITISTALQADEELLDYVLYHEMLHKKHKFSETKGGFVRAHTKAFRDDERRFRLPNVEAKLEAFVRKARREVRTRRRSGRGEGRRRSEENESAPHHKTRFERLLDYFRAQ